MSGPVRLVAQLNHQGSATKDPMVFFHDDHLGSVVTATDDNDGVRRAAAPGLLMA